MGETIVGAVIYCRVSTKEQAEGNQSLPNQERVCREYCDRQNLTVCNVFVDGGESARTADRPDFQRMLAYCKKNRGVVRRVVIQDLSRFARKSQDQANFIVELEKCGIELVSIYDPDVNNTAAGKLAANMKAAFNQYFSDSLSERTQDRMRAAVEAGRFPWPAPIGYVNNDTKQPGVSNLVPDPDRAPLVQKAFALFATGNYTKTEVLKVVNGLGLRTTRNNHPLSAQTFHKLLTHSIYCGYINVPAWNLTVKGLHQPLVTQETFNTVQNILAGKKPTATPHKRNNPDFPLRVFVRCDACGQPLTGGWSKNGHSEGKFGYYWCRNSECRKAKAPKDKLEETFFNLLERLSPDPDALQEFPKVLAEVWKKRQVDSGAIARNLNLALDQKKRLKTGLVLAKVKGEVNQADYELVSGQLDSEIQALEEELRDAKSQRATFENLLAFSKAALHNIGETWKQAGINQKQRVQNLLFPRGLRYSPEKGILNQAKSSLFQQLESFVSGKNLLASPAGFEPALPP